MRGENGEERLKKRFAELSERAEAYGRPVWSEFLTAAEQDVLLKMRLPSPVTLDGGYAAAERRAARFGDTDGGQDADTPVVCVTIAPVSKKFAEALTHRDVLGALMSLGLRREATGDIVTDDGEAWLFCLRTVAGYIAGQLEQIRRTPIRCEADAAPPDLTAAPPKDVTFTVASERLDALVAAVYRLSRADSQALFAGRRIFVNGRMTENTSFVPKTGDIVSVRGRGRFVYRGVTGETKKGRLKAAAGVFGV